MKKKVLTEIEVPSNAGEQLTKHFKLKEFQSHDGSSMPLSVYRNVKLLAKNLQVLRDSIGLPIKVNSGYRSPSHNSAIGGVSNSQHLLGNAADIKVIGMRPSEVLSTIQNLIDEGKMTEGGLGSYSSFTHYDIRGTKSRWNG